MTEPRDKKCTRCKCYRYKNEGCEIKTCIKCREKSRNQFKYCVHERRKHYCKECGSGVKNMYTRLYILTARAKNHQNSTWLLNLLKLVILYLQNILF